MAVNVADGNAARSLGSTTPDCRSTWPAAATYGALLVRVEDCCGVLEQLRRAAVTPAIAHVGGYWAFFVERRSVAEVYQRRSATPAIRVALDCRGADAGLISALVTEQPWWIIEPSNGSRRIATAADVVAAINRAMSLRSDAREDYR